MVQYFFSIPWAGSVKSERDRAGPSFQLEVKLFML
jgi:hypothetical protein